MPGCHTRPEKKGGQAAIPAHQTLSPDVIAPHLRRCGYKGDLLRRDFRFGESQHLPLAGFAHEPADARSACIAVTQSNGDPPERTVLACRPMGAPIVLHCHHAGLQLWKQSRDTPQKCEEVAPSRIEGFFSKHKQHFAPESVYRAKTLALFEKRYQLEFVDVGLMPLVESEIGRSLSQLIERGVYKLRGTLYPRQVSQQAGHWLFKSVFWLVAAKVLQDKGVRAFSSLQLTDVDEVYARLAEHYRAKPVPVKDDKRRAALAAVACDVEGFAHLGHVTTESLSYVYENTLISKETRSALGTHSTPSYLVDYMVWQLAHWIEEIPWQRRHVLEPACGHGAFLVSAMRLLREMLPPTISDARARHDYFKRRLHGLDTDPFAVEIARLSLTLADIPNPNGWDVQVGDMFDGNALSDRSAKAMILLANPPFERFTDSEKARYGNLHQSLKASEMLLRTLVCLKPGAVFAVVVPQQLLHTKRGNAPEVRRLIARDFDLREICLFPDNMFTFSSHESAILVGRRRSDKSRTYGLVNHGRVHKREAEEFKSSYRVATQVRVEQRRFVESPTVDLRVFPLDRLWDWCGPLRSLGSAAAIGQGLFYRGETSLPKGAVTVSDRPFEGSVKGFEGWAPSIPIHGMPREFFLSLDAELVDRYVTGRPPGLPQVVLNYGPAGPGGPWCLKALLDWEGHAVTSRFMTIRPRVESLPLEFFWALLNSPLANAYVYERSMKRTVTVGVVRGIPFPRATEGDVGSVVQAARAYLDAVKPHSEGCLASQQDGALLHNLLLRMDAEVLRLYQLPPRYERQLLDLFSGWQRKGVPCRFDYYFPKDYEPCFSLHDYLSDEYRRSTAGELLKRYEPIKSPGLRRALDAAVEAFRE
jgi:hypothetical protein